MRLSAAVRRAARLQVDELRDRRQLGPALQRQGAGRVDAAELYVRRLIRHSRMTLTSASHRLRNREAHPAASLQQLGTLLERQGWCPGRGQGRTHLVCLDRRGPVTPELRQRSRLRGVQHRFGQRRQGDPGDQGSMLQE